MRSGGETTANCRRTPATFTSPSLSRREFCMQAKKDSILLMKSCILEGRKTNTDDVATCNRQHHPPVCQELACRTISPIVPQYRLNFTLVSNPCKSKGVGLCLPQDYPYPQLLCLQS